MNATPIRSVVLALILLPATAGIVAIDASATCQRFVHTYVTTPVRKHVSKATAIAWAKWRIAHPSWKPKPNAQRIVAALSREEALDKLDFTCDVVEDPSSINSLIASVEPPQTPILAEFPVEAASQIAFPEPSQTEVAQFTPQGTLSHSTSVPGTSVNPYEPAIPTGVLPPTVNTPLVPIVPPEPPTTDVTPEPSSLLLVTSGIGMCGLFWRRRLAYKA